MSAHMPETCSTGKSRWNELGGLSSWDSPDEPACVQSWHICIALTLLAVLPARSQPWFTAEVLYILCFAMKSHFANQMQPSTDLATVCDFCSHYWECLLAQRRRGQLICLLILSKHLWVADKNTQGAMHPELMKPHIPLLAADQVLSGRRLSHLLVSLSSFSACLFKAENGNNCTPFC